MQTRCLCRAFRLRAAGDPHDEKWSYETCAHVVATLEVCKEYLYANVWPMADLRGRAGEETGTVRMMERMACAKDSYLAWNVLSASGLWTDRVRERQQDTGEWPGGR